MKTVKDTSPSAPARVAGAFASDLLGYLVFWTGITIALTFAITVVTWRFGTVDNSVWQGTQNFVRWVMFVGGVVLPCAYVPLYVAHGVTRRHAMIGGGAALVGMAALIGVLNVLGFALEGLVFRAFGWSHQLSEAGPRFLYDSTGDYGAIMLATACGFLGYFLGGALIASAYTRWGLALGALFVPVGLVPVAMGELMGGGAWFGAGPVGRLGIERPSVAVALALTALVGLVGSALFAALWRDMPLGNGNVAWWR